MSDLFGNHIVGFSTRWLKCVVRITVLSYFDQYFRMPVSLCQWLVAESLSSVTLVTDLTDMTIGTTPNK